MNFLKKLFLPITAPLQFIQNNFKAMLFLLLLYVFFAPQTQEDFTHNNLEKITLSGEILNVDELLKKLQKAEQNNQIKGVLFVVDSPGGAVAPSIELSAAIKRLTYTKKVVVYAKGTLASGSYYASIWANKIVANPGSMVGSIGVVMEGADLSGVMNKIGIKTQTIQAGKYKLVGTPTREWKDFEKEELNKVIKNTYNMFTKDVADARKLDISKKDTFANAHIFTASQAKEIGLIDSLGVEYDAKKALIELSGVKQPKWNKEDKFEKLLKRITALTAITLYTYFPNLVLK